MNYLSNASNGISIFNDGKDKSNFLDFKEIKKINDFFNLTKFTIENYFIWKITDKKSNNPRGKKSMIAYKFFDISDVNTIKNINDKTIRVQFIDKNRKNIKTYINNISTKKEAKTNFNFQRKNGKFTKIIPHITLNVFDNSFKRNYYKIGIRFKDFEDTEYAFFSIGNTEDGFNIIEEHISSLKKIKDVKESSVDSATDPNTDPSSTPHLPDYFKPENIIFYGVPGCGKSYHIENKYITNYNDIEKEQIKRVVFHPDYTYSDFVGQILPETDKGTLKYKFKAGPFTEILDKAYKNPYNDYYLIIEEINRGNAAAIFGDLFQLLDRDDNGYSKYNITNKDIADEITEKYKDIDENTKKIDLNKININLINDLSNDKIKIPNNLTLLATMNTSDQNVFTLDTAFQRRWKMKLIKNDFDKATDMKNLYIPGTNVTWVEFGKWINEIILDKNAEGLTSEDKRLGTHFVKKSDLQATPDKGTKEEIEAFAEKVYKYLWDDAFKMDRSIFKIGKGEKDIKSLENIIDICSKNYKLEDIFNLGNDDKTKLEITTSNSQNNGQNSNKDNSNAPKDEASNTENVEPINDEVNIKKEEEISIEPSEKTEENNTEE